MFIPRCHLADFRGDRAQSYEYHAEAENESNRIHHDSAHKLALPRFQLFHTYA